MPDKRNLGFIGVGLMGHGMAKNLLKQGHAMTLLDHPGKQPVDDLKNMGARVAASAKEVARAADVVFMCVTGSPQVEACVYGTDGLLEGLREGAVGWTLPRQIPSPRSRWRRRCRPGAGVMWMRR